MNTFVISVRIYYEDTDAAGVVYHASYLRFMERARTEYMRARGVDLEEYRRTRGLVFAVRALTLEYLRPARYNDLVQVSARVQERRRSSLWIAQQVLRGPPEKEELLCTGRVQVVAVDANTLRPRPVPDTIPAERDDEG